MKNFNPKPYKTESVTFRMDSEKLAIVDRLAAKFQMSRSSFINRCVEYALENMSANDQGESEQE